MNGGLASVAADPVDRVLDPVTEAAATRCLDWLLQIDPAPFAEDPRCRIEAVALAGLAALLAPKRGAQADVIEALLNDRLPSEAWARCDLLIALVAATVAVDRARPDAGAGAYLSALSEIDPADTNAANRALLALAFDRTADDPCELPEAPQLDRDSPEAAASFAGLVERATCLGTRPAMAGTAVPVLLEGAAMACLRRYDLLLGMRLLRAAMALHAGPSAVASSGLSFVLALQRGDGGFGDFDAETLRAEDPPGVARRRLDLAVAFSALWTIAELGPSRQRPVARLLREGGRRWREPC